MKRLKVSLIQITLLALMLNLGLLQGSPVLAQDPSDWQGSATGLSVDQNEEKKTAGLGVIVQGENWPFLSLRGGVKDGGWGSIAGPIGIELGSIKVPGAGNASLVSEAVDWAHNEMTFTSDAGSELKFWVSRLSPAILVQSSSSALRLLAGDVSGNIFDDSGIISRPEGPAYPKYVAYSSGGNLHLQTLGTSSTSLPSLDQNWLLLWYGENSYFVDTKKPLTYTCSGQRDCFESFSLPQTEAYQADAPLLLVFQNSPTEIKHSDEGGVEISFADAAGFVTLLPLFGRDHPDVTETESWSQELPDQVTQKAQWWANHLCAYPVRVSETYAYDEGSDTAIITENIDFLNVCSGGTTFAPLPPMLSIAKDGLGVAFSGAVIDGDLNTEFGPSLGIENVQEYTWTVTGLKKYTDSKRITIDAGQAPLELEQELVSQVQKILNAGHFAPWIFADDIPPQTSLGDIYWLNPADALYHLAEIAQVLPEDLRSQLIGYIQSERSAYPPEDVYNLPLDEGTAREGFSVYDQRILDAWLEHRRDVFLDDVPLYSFFALSRYYDLTGETLPAQVWQRAEETLDQDMREQDWATLYWFREEKITEGLIWPGQFAERKRKEDVVEANRHFAGLVGFVKLAEMSGDTEAEQLGRALLSKAAVLRLGMAQYPRYLYQADLVELPSDPAWQVRYTAGRGRGWLFNYNWTGPYDDPRQVAIIDQFGVYLSDHIDDVYLVCPYLTAFRDMTPELARFLTDLAQEDVEIYINKVETLFPHWYAAFAEGMLGQEHGLNHPIDSFQTFMAKALIQQEDPQQLATYVDIPWLHEGDLFYLHKLAETIRAYRGVLWDDTVSLSGAPGDQAVHLTWRVYTAWPPELTWQIDYDGPTGDQPSPVTDIPGPTRAYTLTGLTNYTWYTVTLAAPSGSMSLLTSNAVTVMPTDRFIYLPLLLKAW